MKNLYLLILFTLLVISGQSQETWGPPYPLTDSLTDNVNATLSIVPGEIIQPDTLYMLWERSSDTLSTAIYARNLTTMGGPFVVAAQLNAHFKHPRVFRRGTGDTLFYFSYETDMNGNWDIYYSVLMKDASVLGPFPFIRSPQNEKNLNFGDPQSFSWEKEGKVYARNDISDTVLLGSDSCMNPVQGSINYVGYEMYTGTNRGVFYNNFNFTTNLWSQTYPLDVYGMNSHLTFGNDSYGVYYHQYILWQHKDSAYWLIKCFDPDFTTYRSFNNFPGCNNVSPSFCSINFITDRADPVLIAYATFASDVTGNMEIYVNNRSIDTVYSNISAYPGNDAHPQLFNNFHHYGWGLDNHLFDIWESYHGGHWQLWATNMDILTGENNLKNPAVSIICSPNPFTDLTHIEYFNKEEGLKSLIIYDLNGKRIISLNDASEGNGKYSASWNGKDDSGNPVPSGIYICAVNTGKTVSHCKIIRR